MDELIFLLTSLSIKEFFNFGKRKGKKLTDEKDYCKWILSADFDEDIKEFIKSVL